MKLLVIFASQRLGGENTKIEAAMKSVDGNFEFDFVHLADNNIHSCMAVWAALKSVGVSCLQHLMINFRRFLIKCSYQMRFLLFHRFMQEFHHDLPLYLSE